MTSTKTSLPAAILTSIRGLISGSTSNIILLSTASCLLAPIIYYLYRYRVNIKQKVKEIEKNVGLIRVIRNTTKKNDNRVICMELDPNFVKSHPDWSMMSLGEYLSQLEPADKENTVFNRIFLQKELNIIIGKFLLDSLGATYGAALLPMLGAGSAVSSIAGVSSAISKFVAKSILQDDGKEDGGEEGNENDPATQVQDAMSFDLSLMELISFVNLHQKVSSGDNNSTPLTRLRLGENMSGNPLAYDLDDNGKSFPTHLIWIMILSPMLP